jgi:predicted phosphodiesterase
LILADVHYPHTDLGLLREAIDESHDSVILLGDSVDVVSSLSALLRLVSHDGKVPVTLVLGDNEQRLGIGGLREHYTCDGRAVLIHGHQGNVSSEDLTKMLARLGAKVSRRLVLSAYAARLHRKGRFVVAGHAHVAWHSRLFRVAMIGALSLPSDSRPFNERGYALLNGCQLLVKGASGERLFSVNLIEG